MVWINYYTPYINVDVIVYKYDHSILVCVSYT